MPVLKSALLALLVGCLLSPAFASADGRCGDHPWCDTSLSADARADLLLPALSAVDKAQLLWGDDQPGVANPPGGFLHTGTNYGVGPVPPLYFSDGPAGPRQGSGNTSMPAPLGLAASFDRKLAGRAGGLVADEVRARGNDVVFAPTVNIMRTPRNGRTFEGYGEDPFLAGEMAVGWIRAAQAHGVIADVKHFAANNQETDRMTIDEQIDERTLREIYLPQFEAAVKRGHTGTVMCAYNKVNGQFACENRHLLTDILKKEWGFKGFVLADYPAAHDTVASIKNGLSFEPFGVAYNPVSTTAALAQGQISSADIDAAVRPILRTMFQFGVFDRDAYVNAESQIPVDAHAEEAARIEEGGITLLRNKRHALPLRDQKTIAVIGSDAAKLKNGGGSSNVSPLKLTTPLAGIQARAEKAGATVVYDGSDDPAKAAALAKTADVAIVIAADTAGEGQDQPCLSINCTDDLVLTAGLLPTPRPEGPRDTDALIAAVADANPNTVVVMETSGPVTTDWRSKVAAIVEAWYPGESGGLAIARVLYGDVNPSGHLPATFPAKETDEAVSQLGATAFPGVGGVVKYAEGILVGYRWFDAKKIKPAYPFGFGLSYTRFRYAKLRVRGNRVTAVVRNVGKVPGATVAQLYVGNPAAGEPPRQLKGFRKVQLAPGQRKTVRFKLNKRSFSYWDTAANGWRVAPGCYRIGVGRSSRDLPLTARSARAGGHCTA